MAGRGVPSDASITGSELHPGSLRTEPTVSREERRRPEKEVERDPAGISFRHLVGRGRAASRWSENRRVGDMVKVFSTLILALRSRKRVARRQIYRVGVLLRHYIYLIAELIANRDRRGNVIVRVFYDDMQ